MDVGLLEILAGLVVIMLGWLHLRQNALSDRLDEKADKEEISEMKIDVKDILKTITEIKVDNARWQGLMEKVASNKPEKS